MNPVLIVREEFICLIILGFLIFTSRFYKMGKDNAGFLRLSLYAIAHVVFDIITVLTVNNLDAVPPRLNWILHMIFYLLAIMFAYEFVCYTAELCVSKEFQRTVRRFGIIIPLIYVVAIPFLPMYYVFGNGTNYSFGLALFVGYGIALAYFIVGIALVAVNHKKIKKQVKIALMPMLCCLIAAEIIQIIIPELLFTGGAVTIVTVGVFFSLENPIDVFRQKAQIDALTGVKSRSKYETDIQALDEKYSLNPKLNFTIVFCDINYLKAVNDNYGHLEGDNYISGIAQILQREMKSAGNIYRMGGDEFMALYQEVSENTVRDEISHVHKACRAFSSQHSYDASLAIGYAVSGPEYHTVKSVLKVADYLMYKNKADMKKRRAFTDGNPDNLNITGLTDRIFDAFASLEERSYPFICNLETNVTRLSPQWVDYFGLRGEFVYDFASVWAKYIHPDDMENFTSNISRMFSGRLTGNTLEYRARNKNGEYVVCTIRGSVLKGKNGESDLYTGTLINHGIVDSIDPVTGLHNDHALMTALEEMMRNGEEAYLLKVSITSFSRINMLYGYASGNDVLCQFTEILRDIAGSTANIYRMDGTKFLICLQDATKEYTAEIYRQIQLAAANEIRMSLSLIPLHIAGGAFHLSTLYRGSTAAIRSSLIYAHEQSKYEQQGKLVFYADPSGAKENGNYQILSLIHQDAISEKSGFYMRYQPISKNGVCVAAEALLRWKGGGYGEIGPDSFIPWLENDSCFFELGRWILRRTLRDSLSILEKLPHFTVNVNITLHQLLNENFRDDVLAALNETGYPASQLCLELTERCRELDIPFLQNEIEFFHSHGIKVALDDVGTGSSAFSLLLHLPLDEVKMDKTVVWESINDQASQIFLTSTVNIGEVRGYRICLEGIEDKTTYSILVEKFPEILYQGFYFARPMLLEDFLKQIS